MQGVKQSYFSIIWIVILAVFGVLLHSWLGQSWPDTSGHAIGSDDAYISYRYANNLFNGYGLVFNPGERVEGYSNFLYTLLITPAFFISKKVVYEYSVLLNCLFLAVTILVFYGFLKLKFGQGKAIAGSLVLAIDPWVLLNSATGLETTLILAITTISWVLIEDFQDNRTKGAYIGVLIFSGLSILSRVDGFILPVALAAYALLRGERKLAASVLSLMITIALIYTAWRLFYYHDYISNTYYVKVSGHILVRIKVGLAFVYRYLKTTGLWIPLVITGIKLASAVKNHHLKKDFDFSTFFFLLWLGYLIYIGGDIYFERFFIALIPMGIYISIPLFSYKRKWIARTILTVFVVSQIFYVLKDGRFDYRLNKYDGWITTGKFLGKNFPGSTVAVDAAGKIPFFSGLNTIDMLGLNDKYIGKMHVDTNHFYPGHTKFDPNYVISKKPELIAAWLSSEDEDLSWGLSSKLYSKSYSLKYLVNLSRNDKYSQNILDVSNLSKDDIRNLMRNGYDYAILVRK